MKKFQIFLVVFLSALYPSLGNAAALWNCRSDLTGSSAFQRYINVQYAFWSGEFESVTINYRGDGKLAFARAGELAELEDGGRQITYEGWPGAALDVRIYIMSASIFDREATTGALIERRMTNSATTEVVYNCSRN